VARPIGDHVPALPGAGSPHEDRLSDPDRLRALAESGITEASDAGMEYFAQLVRARLDVPVVLVTLVHPDRQVFPGMVGLPEPWSTLRATPLTHSLSHHVVATGEPLVVTDARSDPLVRDSLAIPELGVVAYAGLPLTDGDGRVLGSLCATDRAPRQWTEHELAALDELARACSTELRLRLARRHIEQERARTDELRDAVRAALDRSQLLLATSQALTDTRSVTDIRVRIGDMVSGDLKPTYLGLVVITEDGDLQRILDPDQPFGADGTWERFPLDASLPSALAARERRLVLYSDRAGLDADFPADVRQAYRDLGLHTLACAPLVNTTELLGVLSFGWDEPRVVDIAEQAVISTIADYTARALERARFLQYRISVAQRLQEAMLTELPEVRGLAMAARYLPADTHEQVGGDWFDAVPVPYPGRPDDRVLAVTVGDITGHDIDAAAKMGQLRSMLRQAAWDRPGGSPAAVVTSLEQACAGLGIEAFGTMVHAHLYPYHDGSGRWSMTWTNAGHPPPVVLDDVGATIVADDHDVMFGLPALSEGTRADHDLVVEPGSTVVLYTDGLIERRTVDIDEGTARLRALLTQLVGRHPQEIVDILVDTLVGVSPEDDVVVLAMHVPVL
jgi:GAF domain-containing protein